MSTDYCQKYPDLMDYVNLCDYTVSDIGLVLFGTLFWVLCYVAVIRSAWKHRFMEMPMFVAAGNIAWEFVWSFFFFTNMGLVFLWGYRVWFILDLFIFYFVYKYGYKQIRDPWLKKNWKYIFILVTVFFIFFFYFFAKGGYDTVIGATSAYMLSVGISTLYISVFLRNKDEYRFSWTAAWSRACGDIIMSVFVLSYFNIGIIWVMAAYVALLDLYYVYLVYQHKKRNPQLVSS
ncbi:MAG: hypothetical protein R3275_01635 [Saprospiraceae bacterium]|nr:hypothetical protein [Saprospiraceae bacterium]